MAEYNLVKIEELSPVSRLARNDLLVVASFQEEDYLSKKVTFSGLIDTITTLDINAYAVNNVIESLRDLELKSDGIVKQSHINEFFGEAIKKTYNTATVTSDWNQSDPEDVSFIRNKPFVPQTVSDLVDTNADDAENGQVLVKRGDVWNSEFISQIPPALNFIGFVDVQDESPTSSPNPGDLYIQSSPNNGERAANNQWIGIVSELVDDNTFIVYAYDGRWKTGSKAAAVFPQSDWSQLNPLKPSFIQNKPYIPKVLNDFVNVDIVNAQPTQILEYNGQDWVPGFRATDEFVLSEIAKAIVELKEYTDVRFNLVQSELDNRLEYLSNKIETEKVARIEADDALLETVEVKVDLVNSRIDTLTEDVQGLATTTDSQINILREDTNTKINNEIAFRVEGDQAVLETVGVQITRLDTRIDATNFDLSALKVNVDNNAAFTREYIDQRDNAIITEYQDLIQNLGDSLMIQITRIDGDITTINADISELKILLNSELGDIREDYNTKINNEIAFRIEGDASVLQTVDVQITRIDGELDTIKSDITDLANLTDATINSLREDTNTKINNEIAFRIEGDQSVLETVSVQTGLLTKRLDDHEISLNELDSKIDRNLSDVTDDINSKINNEIAYRIEGDQAVLQTVEVQITRIDTELNSIRTDITELTADSNTKIEELRDDLNKKIDDEKAYRIEADQAIIDSTEVKFDNVYNTITNVEQGLRTDLTTETETRISQDLIINTKLTQESNIRDIEDRRLSQRLDTLEEDPVTKTYVDEADSELRNVISQQTGGLRFKGVFNPGNPLPDVTQHIQGDYFICSENEYTDPALNEECNSGDIAIVTMGRYEKLLRADYDEMYVKLDGQVIQTVGGKIETSLETNNLDTDTTLTTKSYVDHKEEVITADLENLNTRTVKLRGTNLISEDVNWRLKGQDRSYITIDPAQESLHLYHVRYPVEFDNAANKQYVDESSGDLAFQVFGVRDINLPGTPIIVEKLVELGQSKADLEYVDEEIGKIDFTPYATIEYVEEELEKIDFTPYATIEYVDDLLEQSGRGESTNYFTGSAPPDTEEEPLFAGDVWINSNTLINFVWTGTEWIEIGAAGGGGDTGGNSTVFYQETQPDATEEALEGGELWIKPESGEQYVFDGVLWDQLNIPADLSPYATTEFVNNKFDSIDLTPYATTEFVNGEIGKINLSSYATKQYVDDTVEAAAFEFPTGNPVSEVETNWYGVGNPYVSTTYPARLDSSGNLQTSNYAYGAFFPFEYLKRLHPGAKGFVLTSDGAGVNNRPANTEIELVTMDGVDGVKIWQTYSGINVNINVTHKFMGVYVETQYDHIF